MVDYRKMMARLLRVEQLSVKKKLQTMGIFFLTVLTIVVAYTCLTLYFQKSEGLRVNIAGRQRMLTQKFTKEFFLALHKQHPSGRPDFEVIDKTRRLFELSLGALLDGGQTFLDLGMKKPVELPGTSGSEIRAQLNRVSDLWQQYMREVDRAKEATLQEAELDKINALSLKVLATMNKAVGMMADRSDGRVRTMVIGEVLLWVLTVLLAAVIGRAVAASITDPLDQVVDMTRRIADGDLKKFHTAWNNDDELGELVAQVDKMRLALNEMLHRLKKNSKQMTLSSQQVASVSSEISETNAQEQHTATQVLQAIESLQEISRTVDAQISEARVSAEATRQQADEEIDIVHQNIRELAETVESVNATARKMEALEQATGKIHNIIESIENIADQTNLLALNATIEAARAGEAGKGFAVVANEIKDLAHQTADSTTEITDLINRLTESVAGSVASMRKVVENVHRSQQKSEQTVSAFESMTAGITQSLESTGQIADHNQEQTQQLATLYTRIDELFDVLKQSAKKADATALVAEELHSIAEQLESGLAGFEVDSIEPPVRRKGEKRRHPRIQNSVKVDLLQGSVQIDGVTRDISLTGLKVKTREQLAPKEKITVRIHLPVRRTEPDSGTVTIDGRITHSETGDDYNLYGISFGQTTPEQEEKLIEIFRFFLKSPKFAPAKAA